MTAISATAGTADGLPPRFREVYGVAAPWLLPLLTLLPLLGGLPLLLDSSAASGMVAFSNTVAPLVMFVAMAGATIQTVRRCPLSLWTPYVGFLAQSAFFFGLGPLVYVFGNPATIASLSTGELALNPLELAGTNVLVEVGIAAALYGFGAFARLSRNDRTTAARFAARNRNIPLGQLAGLFLIAGGLLRYGIMLPSQFGLTSITVPGTISALGNLFALGLALTGYLAVRRGGRWKLLFWALLLPNVLLATLQFAKTAVMITLIVPAFGCYLGHQRFARLGAWLAVAMAVFVVAQPLVHYGREVIYEQTGTINRASFQQRFAITMDYVAGKRAGKDSDSTESQSAWTRLAYAGAQAYAMRLYDRGIESSSMQNAWMFFIPRFVWPGKPIMTGPGADFYHIVTGNRGSFLGLSIYGDAYWQAGWPGVAGFSFAIGLLFGWLSRNSLRWMATGAMLYFPLVLFALMLGLLGPTRYLSNGIVGPIPIYLAYMLVIPVGLHFLKGIKPPIRHQRSDP